MENGIELFGNAQAARAVLTKHGFMPYTASERGQGFDVNSAPTHKTTVEEWVNGSRRCLLHYEQKPDGISCRPDQVPLLRADYVCFVRVGNSIIASFA